MVENTLSLVIDLDTPKQVWKVLEDMFIQSIEKLKVCCMDNFIHSMTTTNHNKNLVRHKLT